MSAEGTRGASVEQLYRELTEEGSVELTEDASGSAAVVDGVTGQLFPEESFQFEEDLVKHSLEELLLVLVALRDADTHGKGLMDDLSTLFDARLSPGTVYPRLHDLEDEEILEMHELVRTKEYRIDDAEAAREQIQAAMRQHLTLGFVFYSALQDI
ncbi:helix-turn-helix transcriptional regulator [Natronomonas amylolytica]|uniref:helix-turn-helix transcriptional regulator n=1 Tax=Natronomonas amylolytica TaxID=3108498 RepID=UPI003008E2BF